MRRAKALVELSRRDFCGFAAASALGLAVTGCTDGSAGAVQTGPLGGGNGHGPDAGHPPTDGSMGGDASSTDAASGVACTSTPIDVGPASSFSLNMPVYHSTGKFFVVRDSGGFYALTAVCTHDGATCTTQGGDIYCPRHGAQFTYNGDIISGPVITGLVHFAMCNMSNGNLGVITSMTVSKSTRISG